jgi:tripartite ATP-independent transporter DctM subunit
MEPVSIGLIGIGVMFLLIILQVPIGISMGVSGVVGFGLIVGFAPAIGNISTEVSYTIASMDLAVIPMFLLMGSFATVAGLSANMYGLAYAFVGHRRGGLGISTTVACGFFGAICGSSPATAATFGRVAFPEMVKRRYSPAFATGCIAAGGTLGTLVPPSVIMIIYAVMTEEFILELFVAAVIPALLEIATYMVTILIYARIFPDAAPGGPRMDFSQRLNALREGWSALFLVIIIIGGIYGGIFTVNEAAAFGAVLSLLFAFCSRNLTLEKFLGAIKEAAVTTGMIYTIIIGAGLFTYFITVTHMPEILASAISSWDVPKFVVLLTLLIVYLLLGSVFDTVAAMLITLPFVLPIIVGMGYSPIWWGIMNVVIIETGMITPPIGLNVFVLHGITGVPLSTIYKGTVPFVLADIFRVALMAFFPAIVLWLPEVLK